jgi:hypothetical protein
MNSNNEPRKKVVVKKKQDKIQSRDDIFFFHDGTAWIYDGSTYIRRNAAAGRKILADYHRQITGEELSEIKSKNLYGDLRKDDTDIGCEWLLFSRSGEYVYDLNKLKNIRNSGGDSNKDRTWIKPSKEFKSCLPTRRFGADYVFPEDRHWPYSSQSKICEYQKEWLPNDDDREQYEKALTKAFVAEVLTKNFLVKLNPVRNTGKSKDTDAVMAMFGDYASVMLTHLLLPQNEKEAISHLFRQRKARIQFVGETDRDTRLNETGLKSWTGGDSIQGPYVYRGNTTFRVQSQFIGGGSNAPFAPQDGLRFDSNDRVFYLPFGKALTIEKRQSNLSEILCQKHELDFFFSYLIDKHFPSAIYESLKKTRRMKLAEEYARLLYDPVHFFLERCCIIGQSERYTTIRRITTEEVYSYFSTFLRMYGPYLMRELNFDFDDNGSRLSDSDLILHYKFPNHIEFKRTVDRAIGGATDANRISAGRSWSNLIVKSPIVYFAGNPGIVEIANFFDTFFQALDHIQTVSDAGQSITDFNDLIRLSSFKLINSSVS